MTRIQPFKLKSSQASGLQALPELLGIYIQKQIGMPAKRPGTLLLQFGVQELRRLADLSGRQVHPAQLFSDTCTYRRCKCGLVLAGGDPLGVHLCQSQNQGSSTAQAFLQGFWVEVTFPHLGDRKGDISDTGVDRLWFVAVGILGSLFGMLVRAACRCCWHSACMAALIAI
jgi:hypothetical protein